MNVPELRGRSALVTGAASGIGRAISQALAANGARVTCVDVVAPTETITEITSRGGSALGVTADVSDLAQVRNAVATARAEFGAVQIGVNCAGILDRSPLSDLELDEWQRVLTVNLTGTFVFAKSVLEQMPDGGRLVLFASVAARTGGVKSGPSYAASKGGVLSFMKWAARHYASRGITINAVAPGPVATPMIESRGYGAEGIPLGRMGDPAELAEGVLYLASDAASWVTGLTLDINGGLYMS